MLEGLKKRPHWLQVPRLFKQGSKFISQGVALKDLQANSL